MHLLNIHTHTFMYGMPYTYNSHFRHMYTRILEIIHTYTYTYIYTYTHLRNNTYIHIHINIYTIHILIYINKDARTNIHTYKHTPTHENTHAVTCEGHASSFALEKIVEKKAKNSYIRLKFTSWRRAPHDRSMISVS